jgi:CheY-like chemotaxis protein
VIESETALEGFVFVVVEDDPTNCEMMVDQIRTCGAAAIGVMQVDPTALVLRGVDCVIVDYMLRGYQNGVEFARILRERGYTGRIIGTSASSGSLTQMGEQCALFDALLTKPHDMMDLFVMLSRLLKGTHV